MLILAGVLSALAAGAASYRAMDLEASCVRRTGRLLDALGRMFQLPGGQSRQQERIDADDAATVVLLVREHLTLMDTATRRDLDDPSTITAVVDLVDGVAEVVSRTASEHWEVVRFTLPRQLNRYVVEKGSIAVNGTSLTVSAVSEGYFEVSLIPTTLRETTAGGLAPGDPVNLEVDIVAKYVEKMVRG